MEPWEKRVSSPIEGARQTNAGGTAYQHVAFIHGPEGVARGECGMGDDCFEQAALHVLDTLAASVAIIDSKEANKVARLYLFDAGSVIVLHVPSAPESEAVSPLNLDLWAARQSRVDRRVWLHWGGTRRMEPGVG